MTNHHYSSIGQYRDVESLNYHRILMEGGKTEAEALEILAARSRDNGRTPMQWDDSHAAGFTTGTPWLAPPENYRTINVAAQMDDESSIRAFYKKLIRMRKEMSVISDGKIEFLMRDDPHVLCYRRWNEDREILVLCNLTGAEQTVTVDGAWNRILLSNRERDAFTGKLLPYDCVVLEK